MEIPPLEAVTRISRNGDLIYDMVPRIQLPPLVVRCNVRIGSGRCNTQCDIGNFCQACRGHYTQKVEAMLTTLHQPIVVDQIIDYFTQGDMDPSLRNYYGLDDPEELEESEESEMLDMEPPRRPWDRRPYDPPGWKRTVTAYAAGTA